MNDPPRSEDELARPSGAAPYGDWRDEVWTGEELGGGGGSWVRRVLDPPGVRAEKARRRAGRPARRGLAAAEVVVYLVLAVMGYLALVPLYVFFASRPPTGVPIEKPTSGLLLALGLSALMVGPAGAAVWALRANRFPAGGVVLMMCAAYALEVAAAVAWYQLSGIGDRRP